MSPLIFLACSSTSKSSVYCSARVFKFYASHKMIKMIVRLCFFCTTCPFNLICYCREKKCVQFDFPMYLLFNYE